MVEAISDVGTKLCVETEKDSGKYEMLVPITSAPATGAAPGRIRVTPLDSSCERYIADRPDTPAYEFEYNYNKKDYKKVLEKVSLTEEANYLIAYQDGSGEKFTGTGETWRNKVERGSAVVAGLSFSVSSHDFVEDTSDMIDNGGI